MYMAHTNGEANLTLEVKRSNVNIEPSFQQKWGWTLHVNCLLGRWFTWNVKSNLHWRHSQLKVDSVQGTIPGSNLLLPTVWTGSKLNFQVANSLLATVNFEPCDHYFSNFGRSPVSDDLCKDSAPKHPQFQRWRFLKVFTIYGHGGHLDQRTVTILAIFHSPYLRRLHMKFEQTWPRGSRAEVVCLFVLRFYGPVNPMGSCRARSVYLTTRLLGRLSPLSG